MIRLRQSLARIMLDRGAAAARRAAEAPSSAPSGAAEWGTLVHALAVGGRQVRYVDAPDWRSAAARAARDEAAAAGEIAALRSVHERACLAAQAALHMIDDAALGTGSMGLPTTESRVQWTADGCPCAGTLDWVSGNVILDLKTTSATRSEFGAHVYRYGYDIQAAAYLEAMSAIHPGVPWRYALVVVPEDPADAWWAPLSGAYLEVGRARWSAAKKIWRQCLETGQWPGPESGAAIEPPNWVIARTEEDYGA